MYVEKKIKCPLFSHFYNYVYLKKYFNFIKHSQHARHCICQI
jgi:hypothetical protein